MQAGMQYECEKPRRGGSREPRERARDHSATAQQQCRRMQAGMQYECEKPRRGGSREPRERARDHSATAQQQCRSPACAVPRLRPTVICSQVHDTKPTVPLRVWVLASASCFAVCAALVLATVAITKWGAVQGYPDAHAQPSYRDDDVFPPPPSTKPNSPKDTDDNLQSDTEIHSAILEKLSMFKNFMNRDKKKETLIHKPQYHPELDPSIAHTERRIEKKDQANSTKRTTEHSLNVNLNDIPEFKPTLPDIFVKQAEIKLPDGYVAGLRKYDRDYYDNDIFYPDDPLYDDYVQSTSMTNYLIEKIQELYQWITTDPELEGVKNSTEKLFRKRGDNSSHNELGQLLQALNESIVEGNVTIVMLKLKQLYLDGHNFTNLNATRRAIFKSSTDLLSFGMLTLDVMLLHNIQFMAWESQEASGPKMLQDPEVFAFNALFMDPARVEGKRQEVLNYRENSNSHGLSRQSASEETSLSRGLVESVLELGLSAARAALHLGRAYKNAKSTLKQMSNREAIIQTQLARNSDSNTRALNHLRTSYRREDQHGGNVTAAQNGRHTELDCIWFLYCKNLVATAKLPSPFATMARINGVALRLMTGELAAEKAIDTLIAEALTGWSELRCTEMLPKCSGGEAAGTVLESITQQHRKPHNADHHHKP